MEVNGNWLIIPYGTHTRYFDQDSGKYCLKFMPFGSMLTKSETMPATRFIKERVIHMAKVILGIILRLGPFGFDASPAFRGGLVEQDAINGFFTDYAHVSRKITQEEGYRRLRDRDENSDFLATSVAQLHLTTSDAQRDQLAELVLDELRHRDELKVIEYLVRPGSGYFVWPWAMEPMEHLGAPRRHRGRRSRWVDRRVPQRWAHDATKRGVEQEASANDPHEQALQQRALAWNGNS